MSLALVRHGRTEWNRARRMQGRTDVPLDGYGRAQADATGRALSVAVWHRIVASPLGRARETAEIISDCVGDVAVELDDALVERGYGEAEGVAVAEAHERWPDEDFPGAEPIVDVVSRGAAAVRALAEDGRSAIVVAHGTLIRLTVSELTGQDCPRILNGEVVLLTREGDAFAARRVGG
ncbi:MULTISPECIES: histidine phosphatase family protein [unclassified Microbacterium]|uniref:histidine phosphatase family protein n=1 Tax=unclassified Microbacterium TaxID=2609290 RepID=UPI000B350643|nr:histidine phosphatase family protein [Microbacterium sp. JB110]RCS60936.1 histidine phosphatase family protein [Microbacterium sp. JB110]